MDPRPAEYLTEDQVRAINSLKSLERSLEGLLKAYLAQPTETAPRPPQVREVLLGLRSWADEAVTAIIRHPRA